MKRSIYRNWIDALNDPSNEQCYGALKKLKFPDDIQSDQCTYCVLGLLRKVAGTKSGNNGFLDQREIDTIGITDDEQRFFSRLNDGSEFSFPQLASIIKAYMMMFAKIEEDGPECDASHVT